MKKFAYFLVAIVMLLSSSNSYCEDIGNASGSYAYTLNSDGTATLLSFSWDKHSKKDDLIIPTEIDGYSVSAIGAMCFGESNKAIVGTIVIPEGVKHIQSKAFWKITANHISISASVEIIEQGAFVVDFDSISVAKGSADYTVVNGALYEKSSKTLLAVVNQGTTILDGILTVGAYACYNVKPEGTDMAAIPDSIEHICEYAFYKAIILLDENRTFHIPATTIDDYAFANTVFYRPNVYHIDITFNPSLVRLPTGCFAEAAVKNERSVKYWSDSSFKYLYTDARYNINCILHLPDGLEEIGDNTFYKFGMSRNQFTNDTYGTITIEQGFPTTLVSIGSHAFDKSGTVDIRSNHAFEVNIALSSIGDYAFNRATLVTEYDENEGLIITLPESLTILGAYALNISIDKGERELRIQIPNSVTSIGELAFNKGSAILCVKPDSYAETWAKENAYRYETGEIDDLSWLYE